jgi:hypothetical protein|tara:strand:- start:292 stop:906 length:615 start_codon:yes stop_codon:yes gene_type:complete
MSAEEEEIIEGTTEEISTQDQLTPENAKPTKLNKNGKPRKILSPEALEKLKLAREKANAIRKESYTKKLEEKVEKLKAPKTLEEPKEEIKEEVKEEIKEVKKTKSKKKTKIIVEQSSSDSDEFEPNDNVVFVKRVSRKKKEPKEQEIIKEPILAQEPLPPPPDDPKPPPLTRQPELTKEQLLLQKQYSAMFSGGFMNSNRRKFY